MKKNSLILFILFTVNIIFSQNYDKVDNIVQYYPKYFISFETLANQISEDFNNEEDQVRALYYWISNNIAYDYNHNLLLTCEVELEDKNINYTGFLKKKYAIDSLKDNIGVCEGYSLIIKYTLDVLNIENLVIRGYAKTDINDIGNISNVKNHSWNAIKINNSWKLIDATWSTGLHGANDTEFNFNDTYFLVEPKNFITSHFPNRSELQFLDKPVTKEDFFYAPIFHNNYYWSKLKLSYNPLGLIRVKPNSKIPIVFDTIDHNKTYFYKFSEEKEHYILSLSKKKKKYLSTIMYNGSKDSRLTIYENNNPIVSFKVETIN